MSARSGNFLNVIFAVPIWFSVHFSMTHFLLYLVLIFLVSIFLFLCKSLCETLNLTTTGRINTLSFLPNSCFNCCNFGFAIFWCFRHNPSCLFVRNSLWYIYRILYIFQIKNVFWKKLSRRFFFMMHIAFVKPVYTRTQIALFRVQSQKTQII